MKKEFLLSILLFLMITLGFLNPIFKGLVPFPGDLLINQYSPWKTYSYFGYVPGSYPTKFQYTDVIKEIYPWKMLVIDQLKRGQIPLWNPYNFAGVPLLADFQSQVFSPFNLFYFILPAVYGWSVGLIMQILLALIFTYLYARQIKFGQHGAILASIAFSCSLYMAVFFQYAVFGQTILWLPLILLCIEKIVERFSIKNMLLYITAMTFAALGGHLQVFFYVLIFSLTYAAVRIIFLKQNRLKKSAVLIFSLFIAFGIAAVQLISSIELIGLSARVAHDKIYFMQHLLLKIKYLILFISPDFYGNPATKNYLLDTSYPQTAFYIGIIPLIFAVSALFIKKNHFIKFYIFAAIVALLGVTQNPISYLFYSLQIPFLSSSSPTNSIFIISFALSIIAGFGFDQWIVKKNKFVFLSALLLFITLLLVTMVHKLIHVDFSFKNVQYSLILFCGFFIVFWAAKFLQYKKIFAIVLIVFTLFDLFYFYQKFNPFVPSSLAFPNVKIIDILKQRAGVNRVWGYGNANISANTNSIYHFFSPDGNDPLYPKAYGELIYASRNGKLLKKFDGFTRSNAVIDSSFGFVPHNDYALKILNILGVQYIIDRAENGASEKTFPPDKFTTAYSHDGWKLYENRGAVKRVFLTSNYIVYHSNSEFEKTFFSNDFNPSDTLLLKQKLDFQSTKNDAKNDVARIISYKESNIAIQVNANKTKMLFLSDLYFPGWKAYVDGKETAIFNADYTFRGVMVSQGAHEVKFQYRPASFFYGVMTMLASLIVLFVVCIAVYMRKSLYEK